MGYVATANTDSNERPAYDTVLTDIADYVTGYKIDSDLAYQTARYCLMDTLGCGILALKFPACTKMMGPQVPGMSVPNAVRVPGYRKFNRPFWRVWRVGSGRASAALGTDRAQIGGSCVGFRHRGATQRLSA